MSPAYGEDAWCTQAAAFPLSRRWTPRARFDETVADYAGQHVFDANPQIIRDLKNRAARQPVNVRVLLRHENVRSTPTRTAGAAQPVDLPGRVLVFVKVTDFRDRMAAQR